MTKDELFTKVENTCLSKKRKQELIHAIDAYSSALLQQHDVSGRSEQLPPLEQLWDEHSRYVPETGYSEEDFDWVLGKEIMLKQDFLEACGGNCH